MKKVIPLLLGLLLGAIALQGQSRASTVKALNNYSLAVNAHMHALTACITSLERYDGLFHDFIRTNRQLGGEPYEKPKPSPFRDEDMFDMGQDDPAYLTSTAIKGASVLPTDLRTSLNRSLQGISNCGKSIVTRIDSMSDAFHGPLLTVTTDSTVLPYRLLYAARRELRTCKQHRDDLLTSIQAFAEKNLVLNAPSGDYIHSEAILRSGIHLCQQLLDHLRSENVPAIHRNSKTLDSLSNHLDLAELQLLKGITPIGNSKQFPNKGKFDGFDLYNKYEDIVIQFRAFLNLSKQLDAAQATEADIPNFCSRLHSESLARFNGIAGLITLYNEYALLIGGGKMKILMNDVGRTKYVLRGWTDGTKTLPLRPLLLWPWDVPTFAPREK